MDLENFPLIKPLTKLGRLGRSFLKRYLYTQLAIRNGFMIAIGKEKPLIQFTVEKDPPSVYWVYRIKAAEIETLAQKIGIPPHLPLCPVRCLDTDEPAYLLTLNVYQVSGLASGVRAEWSVFVRDANNIPHYMVVDGRSSKFSMDPVSVVTKASKVIHERSDNLIHTQVGEGADAFRCTITLPEAAPYVASSSEWIFANDYIYWGNGIRDRTFYSAGLANARQRRVGSLDCEITDGTIWGTLVEPDPVHVLVIDNAIEFVISPWENVEQVHTG